MPMLDVYFDDGSRVTLKSWATQPPNFDFQFYRHPHDTELVQNTEDRRYRGDGDHSGTVRGNVIKSGVPLPEVYRIQPDHVTPLADPWIRLWRDMNPELDDKHFCTLLGNHLALTNNTGFPGRRNVILGEDLDQQFPAFHAPIVTGGMVFKGVERYKATVAVQSLLAGNFSAVVSNNVLLIENIKITDPVPSADWVLARRWLWFYMTAVTPSGQVNYITRKGIDGTMKRVRVPFLTRYPMYLPLSYLDKLPFGFFPPESNWFALP